MAHSATQRADAARILHTHAAQVRRMRSATPCACTGLCEHSSTYKSNARRCASVRRRCPRMMQAGAARSDMCVAREGTDCAKGTEPRARLLMLWVRAWLLGCLWAQLKTYVKRPTLPMSAQPHTAASGATLLRSCGRFHRAFLFREPDHKALTL